MITPSDKDAPAKRVPARRLTAAMCFAGVAVASVALLVHARVFDFICDDAFITLRYARNFAMLGEPIYNVGERVEGYTSFVWMGLIAAAIRAGAGAVAATKVLGALSGILLLGSTFWLWGRLEPRLRGVGLPIVGALALSAPIAAWTLGGLETPLFAAAVVASVALGADAAGSGGRRRGALAGIALALATLTRPEGAALFGAVLLVTAITARKNRAARSATLAMGATFFGIMLPFVAWRMHYYGAPLPNTFYVKTSGHAAERLTRGIRYLRLAFGEAGGPFAVFFLAALMVPARPPNPDDPGPDTARSRRAALWIIRLFAAVIFPYVAFVGGDFLDLYRFFVPVLPLAFIALSLAACRLVEERVPADARVWAGIFTATLVLSPYVSSQTVVGKRARLLAEPRREKAGIEPIGWTRLHELRWAATGRWIAEHAEEGDWMATGAAGAMPFYAKISNLDILGLNDRFVATQGNQQGVRPGHQREAPEWYTLSKRPVFLFIEDVMSDEEKPPKRDEKWEAKGYFWVEVRIDPRYDESKPFYHCFLMRTDRAIKMLGTPDFLSAIGQP